MVRKLSICATALLCVASGYFRLAAQQPSKQEPLPDEGPVIRAGISLVNVLASVRDKKNALIANLEQKDFQVLEDGKPRVIRYFAREADQPLTIGMLVDVSGSLASMIPVERRAGAQFFDKVLRDKDMAFVISFGKEAELLQDTTGSARLLQRGLNDLRPNSGFQGPTPGTLPTTSAGTVLYDAIYLAAEDRLKQEAGRKVIILITDGADNGSKTSRSTAIEAAQKADAIVYSIYYHDPEYFSDPGVLKRISDETGGRMYEVGRDTNLDKIFAQIEEELRTQYSISFEPGNPVKDGSYHKLDVKAVSKDYKVQARKGYYAVDER
jgi:VWFA-related protein